MLYYYKYIIHTSTKRDWRQALHSPPIRLSRHAWTHDCAVLESHGEPSCLTRRQIVVSFISPIWNRWPSKRYWQRHAFFPCSHPEALLQMWFTIWFVCIGSQRLHKLSVSDLKWCGVKVPCSQFGWKMLVGSADSSCKEDCPQIRSCGTHILSKPLIWEFDGVCSFCWQLRIPKSMWLWSLRPTCNWKSADPHGPHGPKFSLQQSRPDSIWRGRPGAQLRSHHLDSQPCPDPTVRRRSRTRISPRSHHNMYVNQNYLKCCLETEAYTLALALNACWNSTRWTQSPAGCLHFNKDIDIGARLLG